MKKRTITIEEMKTLYNNGMTLQEISERSNISKQRVFQLIGGHKKGHKPRALSKTQCIYKGLREWMNEKGISRNELTRRIWGHTHAEAYARLLTYLNGTTKIHKDTIDKILSITQLTYEKCFEEENNNEN